MIEPEKLMLWLNDVDAREVDATLEWLKDSGYLSEEGERFKGRFWAYTFGKDIPKSASRAENDTLSHSSLKAVRVHHTPIKVKMLINRIKNSGKNLFTLFIR